MTQALRSSPHSRTWAMWLHGSACRIFVLAACGMLLGDFNCFGKWCSFPGPRGDDAVAAARVQPPGDGPPPARALRPLELGQVESFRRIARLRLGLPAAEERAAGPPMATPGAGGGNPATSPASSLRRPPRRGSSKCPAIGPAQ